MKKIRKEENVSIVGSAPEWLVDTRLYFAQTGHYRGGDLVRVLGNPAKSVAAPEKAKDELGDLPIKNMRT